MSVTLSIKPVSTDQFKVHVCIPPENPTMRGYLTVEAKVRSKAELKEFGEAITDGGFDDDIAALREMYTRIDGLGNDAGPVAGEAVWDFLRNDKVGSYLVPALIEAYFDQYQAARQKNSKGRR